MRDMHPEDKEEKARISRTDEWKEDEEQEKARISSEEIVDGRVKDENGRNYGGYDDLSGEDAIDLADETPSELILPGAETRMQNLPGLEIVLGLRAHMRVLVLHFPCDCKISGERWGIYDGIYMRYIQSRFAEMAFSERNDRSSHTKQWRQKQKSQV